MGMSLKEIQVHIETYAVKSPWPSRHAAISIWKDGVDRGGHTTIEGVKRQGFRRNRLPNGRFDKGWTVWGDVVEDGVTGYGLPKVLTIQDPKMRYFSFIESPTVQEMLRARW